MGVLDEDVGHPAYRPDKDLVDAMVALINREQSRLTVGNIFGSLLVAMRVVLWDGGMRKPSQDAMRQLMLMATKYLATPPRAAGPRLDPREMQ